MLEGRLKRQQRQLEENSRWLAEEESHLVTESSENYKTFIQLYVLHRGQDCRSRLAYRIVRICRVRRSCWSSEGPTIGTVEQCSTSTGSGQGTEERPVVATKLEQTPTARMDRTNDKVYDATTSGVRAEMLLSQCLFIYFKNLTGNELLFTLKKYLTPQGCNKKNREVYRFG